MTLNVCQQQSKNVCMARYSSPSFNRPYLIRLYSRLLKTTQEISIRVSLKAVHLPTVMTLTRHPRVFSTRTSPLLLALFHTGTMGKPGRRVWCKASYHARCSYQE